MKVLLIGCGAVGLGVAASLYDAGADVTLFAHGETKKAIEEKGIARKAIFKEVTVPKDKVKVLGSLKNLDNPAFDFVLISTKTTVAEEIAKELSQCKGLLAESGKIVIFQNGFGNEEPYLGTFREEQICNAYNCIGFRRPQRNLSEVTVVSSSMQLGSLFEKDTAKLSELAKAISDGGIPCGVTDNIGASLWSKMLYNCTLNPLGAILNASYGDLARCEDTVKIMKKIIEEIFAVMKTAGYSTFWPDAAAYQKEFFEKILPPTYGHRSSTLQDVERKIKTEISTLNGVIVRLGRKFGVEVPYNEMICGLIRGIESLY